MSFWDRLFGRGPNLEQLAARRDVAGLIKSLRDEQHPDVQARAAEYLVQLQDARAIAPLLTLLQNPTGTHIAEILPRFGAVVVEPLIGLLKSENAVSRLHAAMALGLTGDHRAVEPLIIALKDWNERVREVAAEALGRLGDERALDALVDVQAQDVKLPVRQAATTALRRIPTQSVARAQHHVFRLTPGQVSLGVSYDANDRRHPILLWEKRSGVAALLSLRLRPRDVLEAPKYRAHLLEAKADWLLPFIQRLATGEDVPVEQIIDAYRSRYGTLPEQHLGV
jgi:HEAT repeat protein